MGWQLQAPSLLLHRATLVALHAIDLLLHAHLCLHLIGKHGTLWSVLGRETQDACGYKQHGALIASAQEALLALWADSRREHVLIARDLIFSV